MSVQGNIRHDVEDIMKRISQEDIYKFYIGKNYHLGEPILSPFRKEECPSFSIVETKMGKLCHTDFADSSKKGGCIDFVMQLHNCSFIQAINRIWKDFDLGGKVDSLDTHRVISDSTVKEKKHKLIQVVSKPFDASELAYWGMYHLDRKDLKDNNVYSVKKLYLDDNKLLIRNTELIFGYLYEDKWKIYRPLADKKTDKWMSNVPNKTMSGLDKIVPGTKLTLVTKSKKDEMVLSKIIPSTCSTQNESEFAITPENISFLQDTSEKVYINFDSDDPGIRASKHYNEVGFGWINCPRTFHKPDGTFIKDFADLARYKGMKEVINYFKLKKLIDGTHKI